MPVGYVGLARHLKMDWPWTAWPRPTDCAKVVMIPIFSRLGRSSTKRSNLERTGQLCLTVAVHGWTDLRRPAACGGRSAPALVGHAPLNSQSQGNRAAIVVQYLLDIVR